MLLINSRNFERIPLRFHLGLLNCNTTIYTYSILPCNRQIEGNGQDIYCQLLVNQTSHMYIINLLQER